MSSYYSDGRGRRQPQRNSGYPQRGEYSSPRRGGGVPPRRKKKNPLPLLLLAALLLVVGVVAAVKMVQSNKEKQQQEEQLQLQQQEEQQQEQQMAAENEILDVQTIYEGVSINGISLAGMTKEQAVAAVEEQLGQGEHTLLLASGETTFPVALLPGSDLEQMVDKAYQIGRDGTREENLAAIEALKTTPVALTVEAGYSLPDMTDILAQCAETLNKDAKNASVEGFDKSSSSFTYTDGQSGVTVDTDATLQAVQAAVDAGNYDGTVQIVTTTVAPELDKATLKEKFKRLATFTTTTTSNSNRNTNIRLCSEAISGTVIQPGEEFSVNTLTGARTAAKGYKDATVIKNGVYIQEPGGGVCQVSSTLFNAVVRAGFKITERYNHTIKSSYVNVGEDAAIDYPHKDFRFLNNSQGPVAVVMTFDEKNKKLKASVYGIPILDSDVKLDLYTEITSTTPIPEVSYVEDPTLAYGEEVTVTTGLEGTKCTTYLITKKDGKEVSREKLYTSSYPTRTPVVAHNTTAQPTESAIPEEGGATVPSESDGDNITEIPAE